jgi:hypothetical protein
MIERAVNAIQHMDAVTIFGLVAVTLMLVFYSLENRSPLFVAAFAGACMMGSAYGFLQGAWPFGLVEAVWSIVALRRWWHLRGKVDV